MKLLKKLIPTSTLLVATATSLVATSCSKSDDFWMYDMTTEIVPTVKPLNIKDNLTLDQQYDKYIEEIKSNPKIWQEDCAYTLSYILSKIIRLGNDNRQGGGGDIDTSTYMKFGVSEPKIGTANYVDENNTSIKMPTFSFKVKLMYNVAYDDSGRKVVRHGETTIEFKNVMMFPFVTPENNTFGLSLTGNTYDDIEDEDLLLTGLTRLNRSTADWSISIDNDYMNYFIYGTDEPIEGQAIHEHDIKLTSANDIYTWFKSHTNPDIGGELPPYMSIVAGLLLNFNYSYHMKNVVMAPTIERYRFLASQIVVSPNQTEDITFNYFAWVNNYLYNDFELYASLSNDLVLKEVDGNRTVTFPASSQMIDLGYHPQRKLFSIQGGKLSQSYVEATEDYQLYKFENNEVKVKINYTIAGDEQLHTCFQTISIPSSYTFLRVMR